MQEWYLKVSCLERCPQFRSVTYTQSTTVYLEPLLEHTHTHRQTYPHSSHIILTAILCSRVAVSLYLSLGMEQCCKTASRSLMWLTNTPYCQCWGLGTSDSISDTTYITSASGTSLVGEREGGREG